MGAIRWSSIGLALTAFYIVPMVPAVALTWLVRATSDSERANARVYLFFLLVAYIVSFAPFATGYFVAKWAKTQPLLHGLITSAIGAVFWVWWITAPSRLSELGLAVVVMLSGMFGAWLYRYRSRAREESRSGGV